MFALRVDDSGWRWCWLCLVICQSNVKSISHKRQLLRYIPVFFFLFSRFLPIQYNSYLRFWMSNFVVWIHRQNQIIWTFPSVLIEVLNRRENIDFMSNWMKQEKTAQLVGMNRQFFLSIRSIWWMKKRKIGKKWKIAHNYNSSDEMGLSTRRITDKCINHQKPNHARFVCHFERVLNSEDFGILEKKKYSVKQMNWTNRSNIHVRIAVDVNSEHTREKQ